MTKKYPAQRIELFGVYRHIYFGRSHIRSLKAAFPEIEQAEEFIKERIKERDGTENLWKIETLKAVISAWDGES